jgi:tetratricopeptide (TPR) repeat protein
MKEARSRILTTAAALVTLGVAAAAVSCTGPRAEKAQPRSKTTGPTIAKGDKTVAKPGAPAATAKGDTAKPKPAAGAKPTAGAKPKPTAGTKPKPTAGTKPKPTAGTKPKPTAAGGGEKPVAPPKPGAPLPPPTKPRAPRSTQPGATATKPQPKKPTASKPAVKKPTAKKPTVKKPTAKKPTVKKPTAKKPAVKKPTAKKPVAAKPKPTNEASRLLLELQEKLRIERQKNAILVQDYVDRAGKAARRARWDDAEMWSSKALGLDHNNAEAESLFRQARAAKGFRDAEIASLSEQLSESKRVKREQAQYSAQQHWNAAMKAKAGGDFAGALKHLDMALIVVQHDPSGINWGDMEKDVRGEMEAVGKLKQSADKVARAKAARDAYHRVRSEEQNRRNADEKKTNALFEAAMDAFDRENYETAETLLGQYLQLAPADQNARLLKTTANRAKHDRAADATVKLTRERIQEWRLEMKESQVPYHDILKWPSVEHWTRITELRKDAGDVTKAEEESDDTAATRNRLRTERTSFDFSGEQFMNVIEFIQNTRNIDIVVDPEIQSELEAIPITLKLSDVPVGDALNTLNRIAGGLIHVVQGSVVLITKPELARAAPVVKVHAVGDLTVPLTNFIAPNLQLLPAGAEEDEENPRFGMSTEGVTPFGGVDELITLVQNNVANEDYWSSDGVSAAPSGTDKLVIVAEPEVQKEVANFLNDLRGFAGIVVTIETRFLTVTDNFLQDVGVDIRGLGGATPGDLALLDDVTNGLDDLASAGFDNGGIGLPANASGRPSSGAFFNNNSDGDFRARTENLFDRALGNTISSVGGAMIQYSLVDDTDVSLIMRAVEKNQQGRVLQAPSVTVFNTQRANITLITQLTFIQDFDVEVAQTAFIADPIIGVIQDGLVLDVQPTVSNDRKYITIQLKPTIATLVRPIPTFTTSLGAFTTPVTIQIPELEVERAATTVRVPDGGTLLMGGLKRIIMSDLKSSTPWFSSIPFASFFMGRRGTSQEMDNLMIIVKATITDLHEQAESFNR